MTGEMKARTAVILCVAGAVLTFAVGGHPAAVDIRLVGVILLLTGAAGLWPYGGRAWLLLGRMRLRQYVDESAPAQGVRVPLDELLRTGRPRPRAGGHVWAAQAGHEEGTRAGSGPPEVSRDAEASERA
jgi:hypothetical protein